MWEPRTITGMGELKGIKRFWVEKHLVVRGLFRSTSYHSLGQVQKSLYKKPTVRERGDFIGMAPRKRIKNLIWNDWDALW